MKKMYILGLIIVLIIVCFSGCILPDGEPLTTDSVTDMVEERYGKGKVEVKQIDKKTWRIFPKDYPDIKYTIKQKIGIGSVVPVPSYKKTDDSMKQVGKIVVPKFFNAEDQMKLSFSDGIIKVKWNVKNDEEVAELCTKLESMCDYIHKNYGLVVKDKSVRASFQDQKAPLNIETDNYQKEPAKWDKLNKAKITSYLDAKYGRGTYTFKKSDNDASHEGEVEINLNDYPDMPFYLAKKTNARQRGKLTDTLYYDMISNVAFNFPKDEYDESSYLEIKAEDTLEGELLNGFLIRRYFKWDEESGVISDMQAIRKALRNHINQYPMINYADYPKNKHKINPPIRMDITIDL